MKKICIVTAIRSEYGILRNLIRKFSADSSVDFKLAVTGAHLSKDFGLTYKQIETDGFKIDKKIEIPIDVSSEEGISIAMAEALKSFTKYFKEEKFDLIFLLGDRYETLAIATAATLTKTPIAHIHGGELTYGAIDDSFRHSITKMSNLHFASTEKYRKRIIQLGENPSRVFNVGSLGVENIKTLTLRNKEELEKKLNINLDKQYAILIYHPVTLDVIPIREQISILLEGIKKSIEEDNLKYIILGANADKDSIEINNLFELFASKNSKKVSYFKTLELIDYLSLLNNAKLMIGNSSGAIIEAPSFKVPVINIGDRQKGRITSASTLNVNLNKEDIESSIKKCLYNEDFKEKVLNTKNPYEKEGSSDSIIIITKDILNKDNIQLQKEFYDIEIDKSIK